MKFEKNAAFFCTLALGHTRARGELRLEAQKVNPPTFFPKALPATTLANKSVNYLVRDRFIDLLARVVAVKISRKTPKKVPGSPGTR